MSSYLRIGVTSSHFSASHPAMLTSFWNFHSLPCESHADQVQYPFLPAVFSYLFVPKKSAAILAAFSLVMWFISTSTPIVCSFILAICCAVFSFILVSSAKCFLSCRWGFSLSVVHILPHYGAHSNPLNVQNIRLYICRISGVYYT